MKATFKIILLTSLASLGRTVPVDSPPFNCSNPRTHTCIYYAECLEPALNCGPDGYPLSYRRTYCESLLAARERFTTNVGYGFVTRVLQCHQNQLQSQSGTVGCEDLGKEEYERQKGCYVKEGVCDVLTGDQNRFYNAMQKIWEARNSKGLGDLEGRKAFLDALGTCPFEVGHG